jgi:hypothetical protein
MAQPVPPTCDPQVNTSINARAWMGGKRDMESATSTIIRNQQDSILDMSCYDRHIAQFAQQNARLFSDGHTRYVSTGATYGRLFRQLPLCFGMGCMCYAGLTECSIIPVPGVYDPQWPTDDYQPTFFPLLPGPNPPGAFYTNQSLDNAFTNVIRRALRRYLNPNFYTSGPAAPPSQLCSSMTTLWQTAKCTDFNRAGWITLADHRTTDRRPTTYGACNDRARWNTQYTAANPAPVARVTTSPVPANAGIDQTLTYRGMIYPTACNTIRPIPTGLTIRMSPTSFLNDAVCPGVNCFYNRAANTCSN